MKLAIFSVGALGLGAWAVFDGAIAFPQRGREAAQFAQLQYLQAIRDAGAFSRASVDDPRQVLSDLRERQNELLRNLDAAQAAGRNVESRRLAVELKRLDWLDALSKIGQVDAAHTQISDPLEKIALLERDWSERKSPKTLSAYDIPLQWAIAGAAGVALAWMVTLVALTARKAYTFDPTTNTLTLPDGSTISPSDIAEFDKRKWHKFFVTIRLKDNRRVQLDLFRYASLESWALAMERHVEGDAPAAPAVADEDQSKAPSLESAS